mmetsp:Transcript_112267/g.194614  ORF Transcript_112267/g.194614 Transcript_112267/m.194614 type:complete len:639 (-) Transcript_112267:139-2055(-)
MAAAETFKPLSRRNSRSGINLVGQAGQMQEEGDPNKKRPRTAAESQVTLIKNIDGAVCDEHDRLKHGFLLEWMDAASCLSAEKHCGRYAVTLVMDDVDFTQESDDLLVKGSFCILDGKVTRAFGSSMEVCVDVSVEDNYSDVRRLVCHAYFMYVILKTEEEKKTKAKVEAPELLPQSVEEHLEYGLAMKRRSFRMQREARVRELCEANPQEAKDDAKKGVLTSRGVLFTELVMPYHANHMGNTFGGQIMCWMVSGAKKAVWLYLRKCKGEPRLGRTELQQLWLRLVAVDQMRFKNPSHVGDRVQVFARVTRVFASSLEVAVRVTSAAVDAQDNPVEVNVGYLTYALHDSLGVMVNVVPDVNAQTVEQEVECRRAVARQQFRLQRRETASKGNSSTGGISVDFDPKSSQADELAVHCISDILRVNASTELQWETLPDSGDGISALVDFGPGSYGAVTRVKITLTIDCPPRLCYDMLRDVSRRKEWDHTCTEVASRQPIGEDAELIRMVFASRATKSLLRQASNVESMSSTEREFQEMLTIRAWREDEANNRFIVVSRTVRHDSMQLSEGKKHGELFPTGWVVSEKPGSGGSASHVIRIGQFSQESFEFVRPHALALVKSFREVMEKEASKVGFFDVCSF